MCAVLIVHIALATPLTCPGTLVWCVGGGGGGGGGIPGLGSPGHPTGTPCHFAVVVKSLVGGGGGAHLTLMWGSWVALTVLVRQLVHHVAVLCQPLIGWEGVGVYNSNHPPSPPTHGLSRSRIVH